jgi:hypothetical protein
MAERTEAVWAAARVLHEAGCTLPGCVHGNPDVEQDGLDLAEDVVAAAAPLVAAAEKKRIIALAKSEAARIAGQNFSNLDATWAGTLEDFADLLAREDSL